MMKPLRVVERSGRTRPVLNAERRHVLNAWQTALGIVEVVSRQPKLFEVVLTLCASRGLTHLLHRGEQQANQDGNDCYHHQQLDQGKSRLANAEKSFHGLQERNH